MMSDVLRQKLNDYVDGLLSEADVQKIEALLAEDAEARDEVAFLRQLATDAQALSKNIAPKHDLWVDIAAEIEPEQTQKRTVIWRWATLAAAAVLLVAVSSALTAFWMRQTVMSIAQVESVNEASPVSAQAQPYSRAVTQLREALDQRREELAPETVAAVEANLKVIDEAIQAAQLALVADPNNQQAVHTLLAMYRKTVKLQQVVDLPHGG